MPLSERRTQSRQRWRAPPEDMAKINFDGAVFSGENKSGIGVVIRDSAGLVIASCSKKLQQAYGSAEVEALAAATALSFAADVGVNRAVLEGDSLEVITALSQDTPILSSIGPWIDDAKVYSNRFFKLQYSRVRRECNFVTHNLIRCAIDIPDFIV
ncbi:uncharacterized protein LOC142616999 [Castanea sativa]|uniref:uncharacterized protein LOC142616999 n=1 Tax=Castanea sativa TaxID=21020 RepID=UPI003F64CC53